MECIEDHFRTSDNIKKVEECIGRYAEIRSINIAYTFELFVEKRQYLIMELQTKRRRSGSPLVETLWSDKDEYRCLNNSWKKDNTLLLTSNNNKKVGERISRNFAI